MNKWITALKQWNKGKSKWCVPRKGSTSHKEVLNIMEGKPTKIIKVKSKSKPISKSYKERVADVVNAAQDVADKELKKNKMYKMRSKIRGE